MIDNHSSHQNNATEIPEQPEVNEVVKHEQATSTENSNQTKSLSILDSMKNIINDKRFKQVLNAVRKLKVAINEDNLDKELFDILSKNLKLLIELLNKATNKDGFVLEDKDYQMINAFVQRFDLLISKIWRDESTNGNLVKEKLVQYNNFANKLGQILCALDLNDKKNEYAFLCFPEIELGTESREVFHAKGYRNGSNVLIVSICLDDFNDNAILMKIAHEVAHYSGDITRCREERSELLRDVVVSLYCESLISAIQNETRKYIRIKDEANSEDSLIVELKNKVNKVLKIEKRYENDCLREKNSSIIKKITRIFKEIKIFKNNSNADKNNRESDVSSEETKVSDKRDYNKFYAINIARKMTNEFNQYILSTHFEAHITFILAAVWRKMLVEKGKTIKSVYGIKNPTVSNKHEKLRSIYSEYMSNRFSYLSLGVDTVQMHDVKAFNIKEMIEKFLNLCQEINADVIAFLALYDMNYMKNNLIDLYFKSFLSVVIDRQELNNVEICTRAMVVVYTMLQSKATTFKIEFVDYLKSNKYSKNIEEFVENENKINHFTTKGKHFDEWNVLFNQFWNEFIKKDKNESNESASVPGRNAKNTTSYGWYINQPTFYTRLFDYAFMCAKSYSDGKRAKSTTPLT